MALLSPVSTATAHPLGSTYTGGGGFHRTFAADRSATQIGLLKFQSGFFLANDLMIKGYDHVSMDGAFSYTYSPGGFFPFNRFEAGAGMDGKFQPIETPEGDLSNLYLTNLTGTLKTLLLDSALYRLAFLATARVFAQETRQGWAPSSLSPTFLVVQSLGLRGLQLHANLGAYFDRSQNAFEQPFETMTRPLRYAQGVFLEDSYVAGLTVEVPFRDTAAYLETFTYQDMNRKARGSSRSDPLVDAFDIKKVSFTQNPIWITPGLKSRVDVRWVIDATIDLGILSNDFPGTEDREILPPWRISFGITYLTGVPDEGRPSSPVRVRWEGGARLLGQVVDAETHESLANARIRVSDPDQEAFMSIPGGYFEFLGLSPGPYQIEVERENYAAFSQSVEVQEGQTLNVSVPLVLTDRATAGAQAEEAAETGISDLHLLFDFGEAVITADHDPVLEQVARFLQTHPDLIVRIEGHSDGVGEYSLNLLLSRDRAIAVADDLASRGIDRKRLLPIGYGPVSPKATNATEEGRQLNRRVEFKFAPAAMLVPEPEGADAAPSP